MAPSKLLVIAALTMLVGCSDASTEGTQSQDMAASFPTEDVARNADPSVADAGTVNTVQPDTLPGDTGLAEDASPVDVVDEDQVPAEDTALPDAGMADIQPEDVGIEDAGAEDGGGETDTGSAEDVIDECVPPVPMDCDPVGSWTVNIQSAAAPGAGCGDGGIPGQSPATHILSVTPTGNGLYKVKMLDPSDGTPISSVQVLAKPGSCTIAFTTTVAVQVPGAGDLEGGTASIVYAYSLLQGDATYSGPGSVTSAFVTDSGETIAECTEPLTAEGIHIP